MSNYYLKSEETKEPEKPVRGWDKPYKPESLNLLFPSILAGRANNYLLTETDPGDAVQGLVSTCDDSTSWPSFCFDDTVKKTENVEPSQEISKEFNNEDVTSFKKSAENTQTPSTPQRQQNPVKLPTYVKYRSPALFYDNLDTKTLDAARSLFFVRRKQELLLKERKDPFCPPRTPSDYDLFIAWASLPKQEKLRYVEEVAGGLSPSPALCQRPVNSLETERAVSNLYTSCRGLGSLSWPSFEYLRDQPQYPPSSSLRAPRSWLH